MEILIRAMILREISLLLASAVKIPAQDRTRDVSEPGLSILWFLDALYDVDIMPCGQYLHMLTYAAPSF